MTWPVLAGVPKLKDGLPPEQHATLQVYTWEAYINQDVVNASGVIDDFVIVDLLSSSAGSTPMLVIIYTTQHGGNGGPALNALGSIMLAMSLIIVILGYVGYRLLSRGERGSLDALTAIVGEG